MKPTDFNSAMDSRGDIEHRNGCGDCARYGAFGRGTYGVTFAGHPGVELCARGGLDAASRLAERFHAGWRPVNWPAGA